MSLQHIVQFSSPQDLSPEDDAEMRRHVEWPEAIGGMASIRLDCSINEARPRGYHLRYTEFPDVETPATYQKHPVHQEFLRWVFDRDCTPLAFDYPLDDITVILGTPAQSHG